MLITWLIWLFGLHASVTSTILIGYHRWRQIPMIQNFQRPMLATVRLLQSTVTRIIWRLSLLIWNQNYGNCVRICKCFVKFRIFVEIFYSSNWFNYCVLCSDEKNDAFLQAKEELEHKNGQYEKLRREVSFNHRIFISIIQFDSHQISNIINSLRLDPRMVHRVLSGCCISRWSRRVARACWSSWPIGIGNAANTRETKRCWLFQNSRGRTAWR